MMQNIIGKKQETEDGLEGNHASKEEQIKSLIRDNLH